MIILLRNIKDFFLAIKSGCNNIILVEGHTIPTGLTDCPADSGLWWLKGTQMRHIGLGNIELMKSYMTKHYDMGTMIGHYQCTESIYCALLIWIFADRLTWDDNYRGRFIIGEQFHIYPDRAEPSLLFSWGLGLFIGTVQGGICNLYDYIDICNSQFKVGDRSFRIPSCYKIIDNRCLRIDEEPKNPINQTIVDPRIHIISELVILIYWIIRKIRSYWIDNIKQDIIRYCHHDIDSDIYNKLGGLWGLVMRVMERIREGEVWVDGKWIPSSKSFILDKALKANIVQRWISKGQNNYLEFLVGPANGLGVYIKTLVLSETEYNDIIGRIKMIELKGCKVLILVCYIGDIIRISLITNTEKYLYDSLKNDIII